MRKGRGALSICSTPTNARLWRLDFDRHVVGAGEHVFGEVGLALRFRVLHGLREALGHVPVSGSGVVVGEAEGVDAGREGRVHAVLGRAMPVPGRFPGVPLFRVLRVSDEEVRAGEVPLQGRGQAGRLLVIREEHEDPTGRPLFEAIRHRVLGVSGLVHPDDEALLDGEPALACEGELLPEGVSRFEDVDRHQQETALRVHDQHLRPDVLETVALEAVLNGRELHREVRRSHQVLQHLERTRAVLLRTPDVDGRLGDEGVRRERQPLGVIVGLTTYFEWRIYEALYGREAMMLLAALLQREMERDFLRFHTEGNPQYTALASYVPGSVDPDDTFSRVPYCKGALFITALEQAVGREKFDAFLLAYIKTHRFTSIDTATFLDFVAKELPGALEATQAWRWVYEAGLPANCPKLESPLIDEVARYAEAKQIPPEEVGNKWIAMQWVLYLELLERPIKSAFAYAIDHDYGLSTAANTDVRWAYLLLALEAGYLDVNDAVEKLVSEVGRMKYILPIYKAMAKTPNGVAWARRVFNAVKAGYHPIATAQVERILGEAERAP